MKTRCLAALLALALLTGCAGGMAAVEEPAAAPAAVPERGQPAAETVASAERGDLTASQTRSRARPLSQEEVLTAYDRAVTAYSWFQVAPLSGGEPSAEAEDGELYWRVDRQGLEDLGALRSYLEDIFSEAVAEELLATGGQRPLYREFDGALYVRASGGRSRDLSKGEIHAQVEEESETVYSVNVAVDVLDDDRVSVVGAECYAFPYEWTGDRWVFTDFELVY